MIDSDNDLIRRGDALAEVELYRKDWAYARDAIAALPAVTPRVKPLVWEQEEDGSGWYAECPSNPGEYYLADTMEGRLEVEEDRESGILAALDMQPAPDAHPALAAEAQDAPAHEAMMEWLSSFPPPNAKMVKAWADYQKAVSEGRLVTEPDLAPDTKAIREAVKRLQKLSRWLDTDAEVLADMDARDLSDHQHIQAEVNAILALIGTTAEGGA